MALCRGQALDVLRWLGERRAPFTEREFRRELELDKRTANRWLLDLEERGYARHAGYAHGYGGRVWSSEITFRRRAPTPTEIQLAHWAARKET